MPLPDLTLTRRLFVGGLLASAAFTPVSLAAQPAPRQPSSPGGPAYLHILDSQNLRDALGLDAGIVAVIPPGSDLTLLSGPRFMDGYTWYEVFSPHGQGWIAADYAETTDAPPIRHPD
jgi:hypothetical protein